MYPAGMYLTTIDTRDVARAAALTAVNAERDRQEAKWGQQNHGDHKWSDILVEEVGEVSKSLNEGDPEEHLVEELIQVAAVCVSWVEAIRRRPTLPPKRLTFIERQRVFELVGTASTCWDHLEGAGTFRDDRACAVAEELVSMIEEAANRV